MSNYRNIGATASHSGLWIVVVLGTSFALLSPAGSSGIQTSSKNATDTFYRSPTMSKGVFQNLVRDAMTSSSLRQLSLPAPNKLADLIAVQRVAAYVDPDKAVIADAATRDATTMLASTNFGGTPRVMLSDDGILAVQWERGQFGVALLFAGDGIASISFRKPGQFYAENGVDVLISEELPQSFYEALSAVLA